MDIVKDMDRIVREALTESDPKTQVMMLLEWLVETATRGAIDVAPPLDVILGLRGRTK